MTSATTLPLGHVLGTVAVSLRHLGMPDGRERDVAYIADLKIAPRARGGRVLLELARAAEGWARESVDTSFAVVMDGTRATPTAYTGRAGIPGFREVAKVMVVRFSTDGVHRLALDGDYVDDPTHGDVHYRELSARRYWSPGGSPGERSEMRPVWLVRADGAACGRLEDTRAAKRLWRDDGLEMLSAHLSAFAFKTPRAGAALVAEALQRCGRLRYPALFVALAEGDTGALRNELANVEAVVASATVYGVGLEGGYSWNINTAEI